MASERPYSERIIRAIMAQDNGTIKEVIQECLADMAHRFMSTVTSYDHKDLPLAVAVMKIAASGMEMTLDEAGKRLVELMCEQTSVIAIDMDELRRQATGG